MQILFSTGQVARLLSIRSYQIDYAHSNGRLAEPPLRFLGKRAYTPADLRRVAEHFNIKIDDGLMKHDEVAS